VKFSLAETGASGFELTHTKSSSFSPTTKSSLTKHSCLHPALCFTAFSTNGINSSGGTSRLLFPFTATVYSK
jgi:hypothetical protein